MVKITKQYNLNTPSWEELLSNLYESFNNKEITQNFSPGFFISYCAFRMKQVNDIMKEYNLNLAHLYVNILNTESLGPHKDDVDVWFWQIKGTTLWEIENEGQYTLNEGDLIYIPKNTGHNVIPLGPRAGISMSK